MVGCLTFLTVTLAVIITVLFALETVSAIERLGAILFVFAYVVCFWTAWALLNTVTMAIINRQVKH